jgi:hypothetical protein
MYANSDSILRHVISQCFVNAEDREDQKVTIIIRIVSHLLLFP